jgi:hypothetical protein
VIFTAFKSHSDLTGSKTGSYYYYYYYYIWMKKCHHILQIKAKAAPPTTADMTLKEQVNAKERW